MHADRFTERARAYAATRPRHPAAAIAYVLDGFGDPAGINLADLGSGTGLSSLPFAETGARVWAIEPNAAMRAAAEPHPRIISVNATAEQTTLADASIDIVTACTAWHWFDHGAVVNEVKRVLRSRGRLAILEIHFDETDPFTKAWRDAYWRFGKRVPLMPGNLIDHALALNPGRVSHATFPFAHSLDRAGLHAYTDSNSLTPTDPDLYNGLHAAIETLLDDLGIPRASRPTPRKRRHAHRALKKDEVMSVQIERKSYEMPPRDGFTITLFITVADINRSADFYEKVFGGRILSRGDSKGASGHIQIANTWLIVNVGGGPTPDKPTVTLGVPADPDKVSSFMNIRVADIQACYTLWKSRGAEFITEPIQKYGEIRCYIRDPDGYIIEVGQTTDP